MARDLLSCTQLMIITALKWQGKWSNSSKRSENQTANARCLWYLWETSEIYVEVDRSVKRRPGKLLVNSAARIMRHQPLPIGTFKWCSLTWCSRSDSRKKLDWKARDLLVPMDFSALFVSCLARSGEAVCQAPNGIGGFQLFAESAFGYYPQTLWLESSSFTPFLGDSTWRQLVRIYRKQEGSLDGTNGYGNRQSG